MRHLSNLEMRQSPAFAALAKASGDYSATDRAFGSRHVRDRQEAPAAAIRSEAARRQHFGHRRSEE